MLTKNIIKNPDAMKIVMRSTNYSDLELYRYKHNESCENLKSGLEEEAFNVRNSKRNSVVVRE